MRYIYLLLIFICYSCSNERVLQLPQIENADITEVLDVSPAYIFYDVTRPDSTLLNRKNLIGTTNWLVNVDKRLTLKQAIPHIKFLQDKKRNAEVHKNKNAKNYFTCNDTSISNLGFIEFTDVNYELIVIHKDSINFHASNPISFDAVIIPENPIPPAYLVINNETKNDFKNRIVLILQQHKEIINLEEDMKITGILLNFYFDENLSFQDYISVKSELGKLNLEKFKIISNEFIF